jgi:hypothetical protein
VAARKGTATGVVLGGIQRACELHESVARLLVRLDGAMWVWGGLSMRARSHRPRQTVEEGEEERGRATAGALVLFIGKRAPGGS